MLVVHAGPSLLLAEAAVGAGAGVPAWTASAGWVITALITLGIYPALVLRRYVRIMINLIDESSACPEHEARDTGRLAGREVEFRATDGHLLRGTIMPSRNRRGRRGMIVFAHEFDRDRTSARRYCGPLLDHGYDVFAFDFRGHGSSPPEDGYKPRQWPSDRERADAIGAIAFIGDYLERVGRPREVGLFGISRGGGACLLAARGIGWVRAIVTDSAFSSDTTLEYLMKRFATIFARIRVVAQNHPPTFWRFLRWLLFRECRRRFNCTFPSVRKAARKLGPIPVFLIHGQKDSYIPVAQSYAIYECVRGAKRLWIVPGAKHNQGIITQPDRYASRLVRFFDGHLRPADAPRAEPNRNEPHAAPAAAPDAAPAAAPVVHVSTATGDHGDNGDGTGNGHAAAHAPVRTR